MFKERSSMRLAEGWHKLMGWRGSYVRDLRGHHLVIFHGSTPNDPNWYKWIDGYYRGCVDKLALAKEQLTGEACGEAGSAWGKQRKVSPLDGGSGDGQDLSAPTVARSTNSAVTCITIGTSTCCMLASAGAASCCEGEGQSPVVGQPLEVSNELRVTR